MSGKKITGDYEVGYCKPPRNRQFKPGQSGNPRGRPRREVAIQTLRAMREAFIRTANRDVTVTEAGKPRRMPGIDAVFHRLMMKALAGDYRSIKLVMECMRDQIKEHEEWQIRFTEIVWEMERAQEEEYNRSQRRSC
jgi:Family of unknown function (DUF5681)